jgi:hypothetical protein
MNVLEIMMNDVGSVVDKTVAYDFGGSNPIIGKVVAAKYTKQSCKIDGEDSFLKVYGISFDGKSYYTVGCKDLIIE